MPLPKLKNDLTHVASVESVAISTDEIMVGAFPADYTPLTAEQMADRDPEAEELYKNSKHVSR